MSILSDSTIIFSGCDQLASWDAKSCSADLSSFLLYGMRPDGPVILTLCLYWSRILLQGQPRVPQRQPDLRLLRRVQAPLQHQALEGVHRLLQLPSGGCHRRRKDFLLPRRTQSRLEVHGPGKNHSSLNRLKIVMGPHYWSATKLDWTSLYPPKVHVYVTSIQSLFDKRTGRG